MFLKWYKYKSSNQVKIYIRYIGTINDMDHGDVYNLKIIRLKFYLQFITSRFFLETDDNILF